MYKTSNAQTNQNNISPNKSQNNSHNVSLAKAAYLCVKKSINEDLSTLDDFESALQHAGYNPTNSFLQRYWTEGLEYMTYQQFDHILKTEPLPRKLDLLSYFQYLLLLIFILL